MFSQIADMQWPLILTHLVHLGLAYLFALPMALDRSQSTRSAGLRTFPLVAVASCGYTLLGISVLDSTDAEARVLQGIITGIGFIGGGAILKTGKMVKGTATAASLWNTGLIGMAVAFERYEIALVMSAINFLTLRYIKRLTETHGDTRKKKSKQDDD